MKIKGGRKVDLNLQDSVIIAILLKKNSCKPMQQQLNYVVYLVSLIVYTSSSCAPIAPFLGLGDLLHS